ncbi:uncharacterized protein LOC106028873 [Cavia porcellus]|uniref:uncharacterized protein LOC106028873 n=1 Tax=Cavia porcellus TaxID=10141 RepID=UPI002FE4241A
MLSTVTLGDLRDLRAGFNAAVSGAAGSRRRGRLTWIFTALRLQPARVVATGHGPRGAQPPARWPPRTWRLLLSLFQSAAWRGLFPFRRCHWPGRGAAEAGCRCQQLPGVQESEDSGGGAFGRRRRSSHPGTAQLRSARAGTSQQPAALRGSLAAALRPLCTEASLSHGQRALGSAAQSGFDFQPFARVWKYIGRSWLFSALPDPRSSSELVCCTKPAVLTIGTTQDEKRRRPPLPRTLLL